MTPRSAIPPGSGDGARKLRVLFVDDEVALLGSLKNLLRHERHRWEMSFALGAEQALAGMQEAPADVILSDMRMPGMDGAALLARVKRDYPGTARLLLSGFADRATIVRALPVAHQFVSKPCEPQLLRASIANVDELHRLLPDPELRRFVGGFDGLQAVARTHQALLRAANDPAFGVRDLTSIIEHDPALAAKVLQLVNSAYFGSAQRVVSIHEAVRHLGVELITDLARTERVFSPLEEPPLDPLALERLHAESRVTARVARQLVRDPRRAEEAFTTGLLHDIGKVILALARREEYAAVMHEVEATGRRWHEVEQELLGVTHAEVGAYLLGLWGLPAPIVECVRFHHHPERAGDGASEVLAAVHIAEKTLVEQLLTPVVPVEQPGCAA